MEKKTKAKVSRPLATNYLQLISEVMYLQTVAENNTCD